jgi:hypothetical protein
METCQKTFKEGRLFKKAWHRKLSLGCQLDLQYTQPSTCIETTGRLEDFKDTAYSSIVNSDDESRDCKILLKEKQVALMKLKSLFEEESFAKAKLETALAESYSQMTKLEQQVMTFEESFAELFETMGLSHDSFLRSDAGSDVDCGSLLQRARELVSVSEEVDMLRAKSEAVHSSISSKYNKAKDFSSVELEHKDSEIQTLTAQVDSLNFKLSHEQDLNSSYLSQIKELQTKLAQTRRAALVSSAEQEAMTQQLNDVHAELKQLRAELTTSSRNSLDAQFGFTINKESLLPDLIPPKRNFDGSKSIIDVSHVAPPQLSCLGVFGSRDYVVRTT